MRHLILMQCRLLQPHGKQSTRHRRRVRRHVLHPPHQFPDSLYPHHNSFVSLAASAAYADRLEHFEELQGQTEVLHYGEGAHPQLPQEQQRDLWRRLAYHRPPLPGPNRVLDRAVSRSSSEEAPAQTCAMSAFLMESLQRARTTNVHSQQVQEDHDRFVAETQDAVRRYLQVMAVCVVCLCNRGTTHFVSTNARYHVVASFCRCYTAPMTGAAPAACVDQEPAAAYGKPVCLPLPHPMEKVATNEPVLPPSTHFTQIPPFVITSLLCRIFPRPQCCFLPHDMAFCAGDTGESCDLQVRTSPQTPTNPVTLAHGPTTGVAVLVLAPLYSARDLCAAKACSCPTSPRSQGCPPSRAMEFSATSMSALACSPQSEECACPSTKPSQTRLLPHSTTGPRVPVDVPATGDAELADILILPARNQGGESVLNVMCPATTASERTGSQASVMHMMASRVVTDTYPST